MEQTPDQSVFSLSFMFSVKQHQRQCLCQCCCWCSGSTCQTPDQVYTLNWKGTERGKKKIIFRNRPSATRANVCSGLNPWPNFAKLEELVNWHINYSLSITYTLLSATWLLCLVRRIHTHTYTHTQVGWIHKVRNGAEIRAGLEEDTESLLTAASLFSSSQSQEGNRGGKKLLTLLCRGGRTAPLNPQHKDCPAFNYSCHRLRKLRESQCLLSAVDVDSGSPDSRSHLEDWWIYSHLMSQGVNTINVRLFLLL